MRYLANLFLLTIATLLIACTGMHYGDNRITVATLPASDASVKSAGVVGKNHSYFVNSEYVSLQEALTQVPWPFVLPDEKLLPPDVHLEWVEIPTSHDTASTNWGIVLHYSGNIIIKVQYPDIPYSAFVAAKEISGNDPQILLTNLSPFLQEASVQEQSPLEANWQRAPQIVHKERINSYDVYIGIPGQKVEFPSSEHQGQQETEMMEIPHAVVNWVHVTGLYSVIDWPEYSHLQDNPIPKLLQVINALIVAADS